MLCARFGVPDEWTPIGAIAVGHPDLPADPVPPARASERKSLDELVHRGVRARKDGQSPWAESVFKLLDGRKPDLHAICAVGDRDHAWRTAE